MQLIVCKPLTSSGKYTKTPAGGKGIGETLKCVRMKRLTSHLKVREVYFPERSPKFLHIDRNQTAVTSQFKILPARKTRVHLFKK